MVYKIAERKIQIVSLYDEVHQLCKEYISDGEPDYAICITQEDIDFERMKSETTDRKENREIIKYSDRYLETLAVYRKLAEWLVEEDTLLFHGSVIAVDREGYLFTAKSGTGKSTHVRLWREYLGEKAVMVNDDKPLIRITQEGAVVYGTPWDGKHRLSNNIAVPLKAICVLRRGETNKIEKINKTKIYPILVQQMYRPVGDERMKKALHLLDRLSENVSIYELWCNMEPEAAKTAYEGMN